MHYGVAGKPTRRAERPAGLPRVPRPMHACMGPTALRRYWVSWKADGTRYLLFIYCMGAYLVDRSFNVVRLEMRFPTRA